MEEEEKKKEKARSGGVSPVPVLVRSRHFLKSATCLQQQQQPTPTSDRTRLPAEFKHINKRRKRN